MAKKKSKKHGKKKSSHRKNPKRARAAKRGYKGSALHKYNMRRKKSGGGKRKKGYGKKKSRGGKGKHKRYASRQKFHGGAIAARARFNNLVKRFESRGHDHATAVGLAHRASRIGAAMGRGKAKHAAGKAAEQRALANLFGGFGAAGHLAAMQRA